MSRRIARRGRILPRTASGRPLLINDGGGLRRSSASSPECRQPTWSISDRSPRTRSTPVSVYSASKAAVAQSTRALRTELGRRGVRVKNIEPGMTATELGDDMRDDTSGRRSMTCANSWKR
jgi:NAD(P)-dependent dehydrogenase (short-subunit alcohol dehydrogenase family)